MPFIVISKYILINFQTNTIICVNSFTFVHELLDSPSYVMLKSGITFVRKCSVMRSSVVALEFFLHHVTFYSKLFSLCCCYDVHMVSSVVHYHGWGRETSLMVLLLGTC